MLFLLLAIFSSAAIAVIMRLSADSVCSNITMLAANYLTCLLFAAGYAGFRLAPSIHPGFSFAAGLGSINGFLYLLGFVLLQYNTRKSGVVLSSVFMKLGLLVPIAASILLFGEMPTWLQGIGFLLAVGAILLINYEKGAAASGAKPALVLMLLCGGLGDAMSKVYEVWGQPTLADQFLFYTFVSAFILCVASALYKREPFEKDALIFGVLVGIPNFFSAKFLLLALTHLPAVIVYPTFSVATVLVVTLAGVLLFEERLKARQWVALGIILASLILLNI